MIFRTAIPFSRALVGAKLPTGDGRRSLVESAPVAVHPGDCSTATIETPDTDAAEESGDNEREHLHGLLGRLLETTEDLRTQQQDRLREMQKVAVELAMAVASHLVEERIQKANFAVEPLVQKVVQRLEPRHAVTVRLHPDDLTLLERELGERELLTPEQQAIRLQADSSLQRGDCRADSGDVSIVYHLNDHLAEIRQHLMQSLAESEIERRQPKEKALHRYPDRRRRA